MGKAVEGPGRPRPLVKEMRTPSNDWENLLLLSGGPQNVLLVSFKNPKLKPLTGKTLAEVAKMRGKSPEETAMDLVVEDDSRVGTVFFIMNEDNVKRETGLAVDELRIRRGIAGARGRVPQVAVASARLRQCRAAAREICPRRDIRRRCRTRFAG